MCFDVCQFIEATYKCHYGRRKFVYLVHKPNNKYVEEKSVNVWWVYPL